MGFSFLDSSFIIERNFILMVMGVIAIPIGTFPTEIGEPKTVLVAVFIMETVSSPKFVTYARVPSGVMAIPQGPIPTEIGEPMTVLVAIFITETVSSPKFVTYARAPSGVIAIPTGTFPRNWGTADRVGGRIYYGDCSITGICTYARVPSDVIAIKSNRVKRQTVSSKNVLLGRLR